MRFLEDLQNNLIHEFGTSDYNVFFFGSFLRTDYKPGVSDIDVAIFDKYGTKIGETIGDVVGLIGG